MALKQPIPEKQLVLMTDASFRGAGYALMIEDNPDQKIQSNGKRTPPWRLAQNFSPPCNSKCLYFQKSFWQSTWHFLSLHTFSGKQQTNNCLHRQQIPYTFFPTKAISPALWNSCDYVLQFYFKIAQIAGSVNLRLILFSRLEFKVTEKICLKIREDNQITPIEVTTSSSDVADEEQFFFTQADNKD